MFDKARRGLRQRLKTTASEDEASLLNDSTCQDNERQICNNILGRSLPVGPLSSLSLIASFAAFCLLTLCILAIHTHLPEPLLGEEETVEQDLFVAGRAARHLSDLTAIGPRPTGSRENEELAGGQLERKAREFARKASPLHHVEVDVQHVSGSFSLRFLDGLTNVYHGVQNVIVRVSHKTRPSAHSLLVNCHFDTVADSPGASDDGASCAIMMEILRVVSQSSEPLVHNLILLFNGAEENLMQGSHGFITQHRWAKEIRAFVNLEACGAGGREILFQAGPGQPWILAAYAESVPHPYASSLAQEIFQSGIIPGDTDFRIFRDFGNISGLDFAWSSNGYVYHTSLDSAAQVPAGTLQRTGENILALVRHLTSSHELAKTKEIDSLSPGQPVYFDILGAGVARWPMIAGDAISISSIVAATLSVVCYGLASSRAQGFAFRLSVRQLGICILTQMGACLIALLVAATVAATLSFFERTMSWFARPVWIGLLYVVPTLLSHLILVLGVSKYQKHALGSVWNVFWKYFDAAILIWSTLLATTIVFRLRSGYVICTWVFFPAIVSYLLRGSAVLKGLKDMRWLLVYLLGLVPPFTLTTYLVLGVLSLFVPIMGRIGSGTNPDAIVAILSAIPYSLIFMYLHTERTFHDLEGNVRKHESGYWLVDMDHNSPRALQKTYPNLLENARPVEDECSTELYCGMPYLMPVLTFIWKTHWIPGPAIKFSANDPKLQLLSRQILMDGSIRFTFNATGPDHMGLMISPILGVALTKWSLVDEKPLSGPKWNARDTYFVYYGRALNPEPWIFSMDFASKTRKTIASLSHVIDVALTGHLMHGKQKTSPDFQKFIRKFPDWTVVTAWTAAFKSWHF